MNDEDVRIDETAPIVYSIEVESRLQTLVVYPSEAVFEFRSILAYRAYEEHTCVES
jgi:hypothetical protein